jgi:hypothetical protein
VGVDRALADAIQALEFPGRSEIVPLDPVVDKSQGYYQRNENGRRSRNDHQGEHGPSGVHEQHIEGTGQHLTRVSRAKKGYTSPTTHLVNPIDITVGYISTYTTRERLNQGGWQNETGRMRLARCAIPTRMAESRGWQSATGRMRATRGVTPTQRCNRRRYAMDEARAGIGT